MTGWWLTHPSEKWWSESQLGWWNSQYMESHKSHVPNHQPDEVSSQMHTTLFRSFRVAGKSGFVGPTTDWFYAWTRAFGCFSKFPNHRVRFTKWISLVVLGALKASNCLTIRKRLWVAISGRSFFCKACKAKDTFAVFSACSEVAATQVQSYIWLINPSAAIGGTAINPTCTFRRRVEDAGNIPELASCKLRIAKSPVPIGRTTFNCNV